MTHRAVELDPLEFVLFQRIRILDITTEVTNVGGRILWRGHWLAECMNGLQRFFQILLPFLEPILQQSEDVLLVKAFERPRGVFGNRMLELLE